MQANLLKKFSVYFATQKIVPVYEGIYLLAESMQTKTSVENIFQKCGSTGKKHTKSTFGEKNLQQ